MPFFSSEQTNPDVKTAHRELERLSDEVQALLAEVMVDAIELTAARARDLTRLCRVARRKLLEFRGQ